MGFEKEENDTFCPPLIEWLNFYYQSMGIRQTEMVYKPRNKFVVVLTPSLASLLPSTLSRGKRYT